MIPKLVNLKVGWGLKQWNGQISIDISSSNQIQFIIFCKIFLAGTNSDSTHIAEYSRIFIQRLSYVLVFFIFNKKFICIWAKIFTLKVTFIVNTKVLRCYQYISNQNFEHFINFNNIMLNFILRKYFKAYFSAV